MTKERTIYIDPRKIKTVNTFLGKKERFNPRTLKNQGFDSEKITQLRNDIALDGLNHAIKVSKKNELDEYNLIAGERRLRAILGLIDADQENLAKIEKGEKDVKRVLVKNPKTGRIEPAIKVYLEQGVECKLADDNQNERDSLRQAIRENILQESLTEYELLLQCKRMEESNFKRGEQAETLQMSEAWISQSHSLLEGPKCVLDAMENGQVTRTAALTFLNVDPDKVEAVLNRAMQLTYLEAERKEEELKDELRALQFDFKVAEGASKLAKFTGDKESEKKQSRQAARTAKLIGEAENKLEKNKGKKNKPIPVGVIEGAAEELGAEMEGSRPYSAKQLREWHENIEKILTEEKGKKVKDPTSEKVYDRAQVELVQNFLAWTIGKSKIKNPLEFLSSK